MNKPNRAVTPTDKVYDVFLYKDEKAEVISTGNGRLSYSTSLLSAGTDPHKQRQFIVRTSFRMENYNEVVNDKKR